LEAAERAGAKIHQGTYDELKAKLRLPNNAPPLADAPLGNPAPIEILSTSMKRGAAVRRGVSGVEREGQDVSGITADLKKLNGLRAKL